MKIACFEAKIPSYLDRLAPSEASLKRALNQGEKEWMKMLVAWSKGSKKDAMSFNFREGWVKDLTATQAAQLMAHLPLGIEGLDISYARYDAEFMNAVIEQIQYFHNLETLDIYAIKVLDEKGGLEVSEEEGLEVGVRLAEVLASNTTIKSLDVRFSNLIDEKNKEEWGDALLQNTTIKELDFDGVDKDVFDYLKEKSAEGVESFLEFDK